MRLVSFRTPGTARHATAPGIRAGALVAGGRIADLQSIHQHLHGTASPHLSSVLAMAESTPASLELAAELLKSPPQHCLFDGSQAVLEAPIPAPPQMRDFLCFEKHLVQAFAQARRLRARASPDFDAAMREMERQGILAVPAVWYERPIFYHPNRLCVCGPGADIPWPAYCETLDFELEFGCYIGQPGKDIPRERARDHIFGYTIFNDFSARDEQTRDMPGQLGPGKGKDFDRSNAMGPCVVTADELPDPYRLRMAVRVNGQEWGRGNSGDMHWKFEDCIAHASRSETLHSGEFFGSGTVGGGCGLEQGRFLEPGDVVELEVEGIGVLSNRVIRT